MAEVELSISDGIAVITLNAPERRNALTVDMAGELTAACGTVDADESVAAAVIRGAGKGFCSGAQLHTLTRAGADPAADQNFRDLDAVYQSFYRVGQLTVPTIAAVHGAAVGAGLNLALATDLRIVAKDARLFAGFRRLGLHPGGGHFSLLNRAAGREAAAAIGLFAQEIDGETAVRLGLAWEATTADLVSDRAHEIVAALSHDPALSRRMVRNFRKETGPSAVDWDIAIDVERSHQMWSFRRATTEQ